MAKDGCMLARDHSVDCHIVAVVEWSLKFAKFDAVVGLAMMKKPVGERRTPTDLWAGLGFSKSMPDAEIHNWLDKGLCYRGPGMSTTYEVCRTKSLLSLLCFVRANGN